LFAHGVVDSPNLCSRLLEEAGVALTPGNDFEDPSTGLGLKRIRFSYSRDTAEVTEGMKRFERWWLENMK
jgi:aspartate/methionine/tyrosine aminotransferase